MKTKIITFSFIVGFVAFIAGGVMEICHFYESLAVAVGPAGLYILVISAFVAFNYLMKGGDKWEKWALVFLQIACLCAFYGITAVIIIKTYTNIPSYWSVVSDIVGCIAIISATGALISFIVDTVKYKL